ncbi:Adenylate cyclase [Patulibacter medicamentivorans]|uniref:Adenylate cyclase n=1 Tax=Patulibacter medicamentivorans TaxID=1097667 RepID=H0EAR2_9ACTN|nr:adenylate/guanylate cyclase domain-containing protein [Patulibacter medicamentivorans]EHN09237.1 Adenylate cyclase [Patulibacter medicamentivorans]
MPRRPLHELYRRLGARYPFVAVLLVVAQAHVVVLCGLLVLARYVSLSLADWLIIFAVAQGFTLVENVAVLRASRSTLDVTARWHAADEHAEQDAIAAWRALTGMPLRMVAAGAAIRTLIWATLTIVVICWVAGLPAFPGGFALGLAATVVISAGILVRFLELELVLRPVVEAITPDLPDTAYLDATLSLRWRLLVGVPLITVVTGGIVAGFSSGDAGLSAFGLGVAVALAASATIALGLSSLLARSFIAPIRALQETTERVAAGDLRTRAPVLGGDEIGRLARSFNVALEGLRERDRLHEALDAYVDPVVAERLLDEGPRLEGELREVTVAFIDIRGFTAFAEQATAHEVFSLLNEFYGVVVPVLERYGGSANAFQGDGLLAVFGAPVALTDHADAAVTAAIEVARAVRQRFGQRLQVGIGVNSGTVVAGTIGGGNRVTFTVIGDAVNTAHRVEAITRQTGDVVLFTEETRRRLRRDHGTISGRPPAPVRGKRTAVRLHAPMLAGRVEEGIGELEQRLGELAHERDAGPGVGA